LIILENNLDILFKYFLPKEFSKNLINIHLKRRKIRARMPVITDTISSDKIIPLGDCGILV
jgi:hypothetical protein